MMKMIPELNCLHIALLTICICLAVPTTTSTTALPDLVSDLNNGTHSPPATTMATSTIISQGRNTTTVTSPSTTTYSTAAPSTSITTTIHLVTKVTQNATHGSTPSTTQAEMGTNSTTVSTHPTDTSTEAPNTGPTTTVSTTTTTTTATTTTTTTSITSTLSTTTHQSSPTGTPHNTGMTGSTVSPPNNTQGSALTHSEKTMTIFFSVFLGAVLIVLLIYAARRCKRPKTQYAHRPLHNTTEDGVDRFVAADDTLIISGGLYDGPRIYNPTMTTLNDDEEDFQSRPPQFRLEFLNEEEQEKPPEQSTSTFETFQPVCDNA